MTVTAELIRELLRDLNPTADVPAALAVSLRGLEVVERQRRKLEAALQTEGERHQAAVVAIRAELRTLYQSCSHPVPEFQGDPAGGSDSFHTCVFCGKSW